MSKEKDTMQIRHGFEAKVKFDVTETYKKMGKKKLEEMRKKHEQALDKNLKALLSMGVEGADVEVEVTNCYVKEEGRDHIG